MDFVARIRLVVDVPFTAAGDTDEERIAAAAYAESTLAPALGADLTTGSVIDVMVEEVRQP
jgi:hypothetical protein